MMKNVHLLIILFLITSIVACKKKIECRSLVLTDEKYYYEGTLFSGTCEYYYENGKLRAKQSFESGIESGKWYAYGKASGLFQEGNKTILSNEKLLKIGIVKVEINEWKEYKKIITMHIFILCREKKKR